jgi:hypothetical protein
MRGRCLNESREENNRGASILPIISMRGFMYGPGYYSKRYKLIISNTRHASLLSDIMIFRKERFDISNELRY